MAGIGFELRKLLKRDSLLGMMQAYAYAGIISSGPWVLSIIGILVIGLMSISMVVPEFLITQFQVSVTYLIAFSLTLTGFAQLAFTRFTADRLFEKRANVILPNFNGLLLWVTLLTGLFGTLVIIFLFPNQSVMYRLLMLAGFVVMSDIWIATIFLSGMKQYSHLCLGTLHANSTNQTFDRIINFFPDERRNQLLMDLSANLRAIVSQRLVRTPDGRGRRAAIEILLNTQMDENETS